MESSASFPMWLSSTLKTREKNCQQTTTNCVTVLSSDSQTQSSPSASPTCNPDENFQHENHSQLILSKMNNFFKAGKLKDVTLIAGKLSTSTFAQYISYSSQPFLFEGEKRIEGHRMVLSAASDYFAAMFTNEFGESSQNEIELQAVDPDALEALVGYCYTGNQKYLLVVYVCLRIL